jgi:hypothetical protein
MLYIKTMEVYESHKLRTYGLIGLTLCFAVPLMVFTGFAIVEGGIFLTAFIFIDCLVLLPLSLMSFYFYYFRLWIKFVIDNEKFEIIGPHQKKTMYWSEFDNMRLKVKGTKIGLIQATSRDRVNFRIHFYRGDSKRIVKFIKFHFFKQEKGRQILDLILNFSQELGKDVILTKRYI